MSPVHVHLALNHAPLFAVLFGVPIVAYGLVSRAGVATRIGLVMLAVAALLAVPVFLSGEPAEEGVEHLPGVSEPAIEAHEDAAKLALAATVALGLLAGGVLVASRRRPDVASAGAGLTLAVAVVAGGLLLYTAMLGGRVRHTEIRSGASTSGHETSAWPAGASVR